MSEYSRTVEMVAEHKKEYTPHWVKSRLYLLRIQARTFAAALEIADAIDDGIATDEQMSRVIGCWRR